ncbi:MAG: methionyl-tRNA formyltransferase [bacterium]|nr:methionyl-tRNA formyltransferase [bacterium]
MRLVFMGTPEFARATLAHLCDSDHEILAVVTGQEKPVGRNRKPTPTEVCQEADCRGFRILTPKSLKSEKLYDELKEMKPDLFVVAAFRILPPRLIGLPRLGSINVHTSLLPKYRGAAPIHWALINGETETGLTSFFLKETIDTGDMIHQEIIAITENDTYDTLHDRLCQNAGPFLLKTLELIERGETRPLPQEDSRATGAPKINALDALIDFGLPAARVRDFVRGLATRPGAYTFFRGSKIKIHACALSEDQTDPATRPGTVLPDKKRLLVQGGDSAVELLKVVPAGKREMDGRSFKNGFRPEPGEVFGEIPKGAQEKL